MPTPHTQAAPRHGEDRRKQRKREATDSKTNCKIEVVKESGLRGSIPFFPPFTFQVGFGYETVSSGTLTFLFTLKMIKFFIMYNRIIEKESQMA